MALLYHRHYGARYRAVADLIPPLASVLDVCCGPAILYERYLRHKDVDYTGIDISRPFIDRLNARGGRGYVWNVRSEEPLPGADFVVMHASLCHFLPDPSAVVGRMLRAAGKQVIIAEPIRNMTSSSIPVCAAIGRRFTDPGDGQSAQRFNEDSLDVFFKGYSRIVTKSFLIPGGREKVFVLDAVRFRDGGR
jgi:SAM-dependent methyltransferase